MWRECSCLQRYHITRTLPQRFTLPQGHFLTLSDSACVDKMYVNRTFSRYRNVTATFYVLCCSNVTIGLELRKCFCGQNVLVYNVNIWLKVRDVNITATFTIGRWVNVHLWTHQHLYTTLPRYKVVTTTSVKRSW